MCRAVCSLTRQLFWEEWETCLESWMAQHLGHAHVECTIADLLGEKYNEGEDDGVVEGGRAGGGVSSYNAACKLIPDSYRSWL